MLILEVTLQVGTFSLPFVNDKSTANRTNVNFTQPEELLLSSQVSCSVTSISWGIHSLAIIYLVPHAWGSALSWSWLQFLWTPRRCQHIRGSGDLRPLEVILYQRLTGVSRLMCQPLRGPQQDSASVAYNDKQLKNVPFLWSISCFLTYSPHPLIPVSWDPS